MMLAESVNTMLWRTSRHTISLSQPQVMGIVNVTPDSFFDGGVRGETQAAIRHCEQLVKDGVHILDIGGESTRPQAQPLPLDVELARVLPVLRAALSLGVPVSVDTYKPQVMQAALELGADIINDITALQTPGALATVASHAQCGVCLMHMQGQPQTMQQDPHYGDVVLEVGQFLRHRAEVAQAAGVAPQRIVLDPGIGFGKTVGHNLSLLARQSELASMGFPLLVGWSRKSTLGALTGRGASERLASSVAAALGAVLRGAKIVRVHDVAATVDALKVWAAVGLGSAVVL
jgi:dihydropteroate synthase